MAGFIEGADRAQLALLPGSLDDWVDKDNPVRVIDAFVAALDLKSLGFDTVIATDIGRPGYHPAVHLKLYIYGYLNRVCSRAVGWSARRSAISKSCGCSAV